MIVENVTTVMTPLSTRGTTYHVLNPLTPWSICNSPHCQPFNSYYVSSENLVLDQPIIPNLIFFSILITYSVDIVLIL